MTKMTNKNTLLNIKTRKKNDFRQLEEGAYPRAFIEQVENAIAAVATGKLRGIKMAKRDKRTNAYLISMGFGKRNTWFPQGYIPRGAYAECGSREEAIRALQAILKAARAREFDDALEDLRKERQEHAQKMIKARDKCGFHRMHQLEGQSLLPAPVELPMQHVGHGQVVQAEVL